MHALAALAMLGASVTADDYARAERFLPWNEHQYVVNGSIQHYWIGTQDRFWYRRTTQQGAKQFVVVDAATGRRVPAFDHARVAAGLSKAANAAIDPAALPFMTFRYTADERAIQFLRAGQIWTCGVKTGSCTGEPSSTQRLDEAVSPDQKWAVSFRDHNLWLRSSEGGEPHALTSDGVEHNSYADPRGGRAVSDKRHPIVAPPQVAWSPDSKYVLTYKIDERDVRELYLVQSMPDDGSFRPKLYTFRYPIPGDEHIFSVQPVVLDVKSARRVEYASTPINGPYDSVLKTRYLWWSEDSRTAFLIQRDRYSRSVALIALDPATGTTRTVLQETNDTWVRTNGDDGIWSAPAVRTLENGDVIWWSERDGWGHLYYYDGATGKLRNQITAGAWVVRSIVRVDEARGRIYFLANGREAGRDPYKQHLYSVKFDGSGMRLLTPEDAQHSADALSSVMSGESPGDDVSSGAERFSFSGRYFVDSYSGPDLPPVLVVRAADGRLVKRLEQADTSKLRKDGYPAVEPFKVLAADGKTEIYGNLFRPSHFDPDRKYPLIDSIYPGPQIIRTNKSYVTALFDPLQSQSLAELGFVVVTIDGRGTPHRAKVFSDYSYGRLDKASDLQDHIAGIRQLAQKYPYIDLDRVGIWGASGGGYASTHALLEYPDFYKVAVSAVGSQDPRGYIAHWGETYLGPDNDSGYLKAANVLQARNLKGKLLLMCGELDDNVAPWLTLKLADALIEENKDFELMIVTNGSHGSSDAPYFIRRQWDFFVRNLLGMEPPAAYKISQPEWMRQLTR
jgi:dipeptidyl-peptidase 4